MQPPRANLAPSLRFRRHTAEHVYRVEAAHNPEVAGSNPAPATAKGAGNGAFRSLSEQAANSSASVLASARPPTARAEDVRWSSLTCDCDLHAFVRREQMIDILRRLGDVELHPVHLPAEDALLRRVVAAVGRGGVTPGIGRLVHGEEERHGRLGAAFAGLLAVDV